MPKMRTNRSAAKRFRAVGNGKLKRAKAFARHQMSAKSRKQKRRLRKGVIVAAADAPGIRRLLPYL